MKVTLLVSSYYFDPDTPVKNGILTQSIHALTNDHFLTDLPLVELNEKSLRLNFCGF